MKHFSRQEIYQLEKIFRINLINSCTGFKSANLIATKSNSGVSNVAVFSSITHLGSNPPVIGFITRPNYVPRHTIENIRETKSYTINHIYNDIISDAHHTSAAYDREVSEFTKTGLEEEYKPNCFAPFVKNCPVQIEMSFLEEIPIKVNDTILVIGEIKNLYILDNLVNTDGSIELIEANVATIQGLDTYCIPKKGTKFSYQRPK